MNNTITKIGGVLSNEVLPLHSKQVPVSYGLATSKYITPFGLGSELPGGLHSCRKLVVYSKAHGTLFLHPKEESKAFALTLLIQVTMSGQEESLASQMESLRIDSALRIKGTAFVNLQVQIYEALT
jgi:hypothetical protein